MSERIRLYRPSNHTEGEGFIGTWCARCTRDRSYREGIHPDECDADELCQIVLKAMHYDTSDPEYPREWRYADGRAICTAWLAVPEAYRCPRTTDLFGEVHVFGEGA